MLLAIFAVLIPLYLSYGNKSEVKHAVKDVKSYLNKPSQPMQMPQADELEAPEGTEGGITMDDLLSKMNEIAKERGQDTSDDLEKLLKEASSNPLAQKGGTNLDELSKQRRGKVMMNPYVEKLVYMEMSDIQKFFLSLFAKLSMHDLLIKRIALYFSGGLIIMMLALFKTPVSGLACRLSTAASILGFSLVIVSMLLGIGSWLSMKLNIYKSTGGLFLIGPLALVASSTISLKIYDFNNSLISRLIFAVTCLTISSGVVRFV